MVIETQYLYNNIHCIINRLNSYKSFKNIILIVDLVFKRIENNEKSVNF